MLKLTAMDITTLVYTLNTRTFLNASELIFVTCRDDFL